MRMITDEGTVTEKSEQEFTQESHWCRGWHIPSAKNSLAWTYSYTVREQWKLCYCVNGNHLMSTAPQSLDQWHILKEFSWDIGAFIPHTVWWLHHGLNDQSTVVWFLTDPRKFSLLQIQTSTDAHPKSYSLGNEPSASWDKPVWTCKMFASFTRKYASENFKWKHIYL